MFLFCFFLSLDNSQKTRQNQIVFSLVAFSNLYSLPICPIILAILVILLSGVAPSDLTLSSTTPLPLCDTIRPTAKSHLTEPPASVNFCDQIQSFGLQPSANGVATLQFSSSSSSVPTNSSQGGSKVMKTANDAIEDRPSETSPLFKQAGPLAVSSISLLHCLSQQFGSPEPIQDLICQHCHNGRTNTVGSKRLGTSLTSISHRSTHMRTDSSEFPIKLSPLVTDPQSLYLNDAESYTKIEASQTFPESILDLHLSLDPNFLAEVTEDIYTPQPKRPSDSPLNLAAHLHSSCYLEHWISHLPPCMVLHIQRTKWHPSSASWDPPTYDLSSPYAASIPDKNLGAYPFLFDRSGGKHEPNRHTPELFGHGAKRHEHLEFPLYLDMSSYMLASRPWPGSKTDITSSNTGDNSTISSSGLPYNQPSNANSQQPRPTRPSHRYVLRSLIVHQGHVLQAGHYIAYRAWRRPNVLLSNASASSSQADQRARFHSLTANWRRHHWPQMSTLTSSHQSVDSMISTNKRKLKSSEFIFSDTPYETTAHRSAPFTWLLASDTCLMQASPTEVFSSQAYLLFYEREDAAPHLGPGASRCKRQADHCLVAPPSLICSSHQNCIKSRDLKVPPLATLIGTNYDLENKTQLFSSAEMIVSESKLESFELPLMEKYRIGKYEEENEESGVDEEYDENLPEVEHDTLDLERLRNATKADVIRALAQLSRSHKKS
ncbi:unnamed protein product [Protopolystoma xenopodis]|uniref:ubiquitinyl hydrolase 1 n=1 Tax=Protopolystoma xenopodis TaxID=117903 RepID=A0A3S4ZQ28_9PLAT|nr:unnamed protein product [Protopolystoma xenopodis]